MYSFKNDYSEGAHPQILNALLKSNLNQEAGYGYDCHSLQAAKYLKNAVKDTDAHIHFISGGTQTNLIAISAFLRSHEACIAASTGHIAVHETGAIEATGHKIFIVDTDQGKLTPEHITQTCDMHSDEHMVKPKLVYISNPTELGTVYSKEELKALADICKMRNLILYCDGARLGTVLCQKKYDISLEDMYKLTDAFFIGGTKNGALLGEALVIRNETLRPDMKFHIKQRGALLAKGRILGSQFEELFRDDLYYKLAMHGVEMARKLEDALRYAGYSFLVEPETNQIFPILDYKTIELLQTEFDFYVWQPIDDQRAAIRLITSWATTTEAVDAFISRLK